MSNLPKSHSWVARAELASAAAPHSCPHPPCLRRSRALLPDPGCEHIRVQRGHGHQHPIHTHHHQPEPPHRLVPHPHLRDHQPPPPGLHQDNPGPWPAGPPQVRARPQKDQGGEPRGPTCPGSPLPHPGLRRDCKGGQDIQVGVSAGGGPGGLGAEALAEGCPQEHSNGGWREGPQGLRGAKSTTPTSFQRQ